MNIASTIPNRQIGTAFSYSPDEEKVEELKAIISIFAIGIKKPNNPMNSQA